MLGSVLATAPSGPDRPRAQVIQAVERGAFVHTELGPGFNLTGFGDSDASVGAALSVHVGYDLWPVFNLSVGVFGLTAPNGQAFDPDAPAASSDTFVGGLTLRAQLALLTSERDFLWARVEGGVATPVPTDEVNGVLGGALSYEHFTKLRHFSLGATAGVLVFTEGDPAVSLLVTPTMKFTF
jgi:hypothetical protein